jgi:CheY-like chemotaxis protein
MNLSQAQVLLVDDEPELREILARWLTVAGCGHVRTAAGGEAALAILKETHIDLLVTDVRMPGMDGLTLVRRVYEAGGAIPGIVFISGFGEIDEREMYGYGVEAFISKPLGRDKMIAIMQRALAERSTLWLYPMESAPRQTLRIENAVVDRTNPPHAGAALGREGSGSHPSVRFGKGGFSMAYDQSLASNAPVSLGKVAFRCSFPEGPHEILGEGYVRWRSRTEGKVGIEFTWLDPACRPWVIEQIEAAQPRSFIPSD